MKLKPVRKVRGEGWDVANTPGWEDGDKQIWATTEPENALPAFEDDEHAIRYIIARAKRGDTECIDALWEVLDHDTLTIRLMWEESK
jgi:hypothetical protein